MSEELRNQLGVKEDQPNDWFETLYSHTSESGEGVPWANMAPHPIFKKWLDGQASVEEGKKALVIGCGLGDDAIELEAKGYKVTAFDVSDSAIELCKKRFPNTQVTFVQADLIAGIEKWYKQYDLVLEIFTIQALPPKYEKALIKNVADLVADNGTLVMITEVQYQQRTFENGPPWLLNKNYVESFEQVGLKKVFNSNDQEPEMGDEIHLTIFQR